MVKEKTRCLKGTYYIKSTFSLYFISLSRGSQWWLQHKSAKYSPGLDCAQQRTKMPKEKKKYKTCSLLKEYFSYFKVVMCEACCKQQSGLNCTPLAAMLFYWEDRINNWCDFYLLNVQLISAWYNDWIRLNNLFKATKICLLAPQSSCIKNTLQEVMCWTDTWLGSVTS